jgi:hypothetical protein
MTLTATLRLLPALRPSHHFHVVSFGRFDATLSRVEKTSVLTLTDLRPLRPLRFASCFASGPARASCPGFRSRAAHPVAIRHRLPLARSDGLLTFACFDHDTGSEQT